MPAPAPKSNPVAESGVEAYQKIFTDPRPCQLCARPVAETGPTFCNADAGVRHCLLCLEKSLDDADDAFFDLVQKTKQEDERRRREYPILFRN